MKCKVKECTKKGIEIIGTCKFCTKTFCLNHRLVELHSCSQIQTCRQQALSKNTNVLLKNKCTSTKIDIL